MNTQQQSPLAPDYLSSAARSVLDSAINWALVAVAREELDPAHAWMEHGSIAFRRARGDKHIGEWNAAQEYFTRRFNALWRLHCVGAS